MNKVSSDTIARTIVLALALLNQLLAIFGKGTIPFTENDIYQSVSVIATVVSGIVAWWKNNSFTSAAINADKIMKADKKASK